MLSILEKPMVRVPLFFAVSLVAFTLAAVITFPDEELKEIVSVQIEKALGHKYEVKIADLDLWHITGVSIEGLTIKERIDPSESEPANDDEPLDLPLSVTIEEVNVRVAVLKSIIYGPTVDFVIEVTGGEIEGSYSQSSDARRFTLDIDNLDLRKTTAITAVTGVPFFGTLNGEVDLVLEPKKLQFTEGFVNFEGSKITFGPATVKTDKFPPMTYFEVPQTNFGTFVARMEVDPKKKGELKIANFEAGGRDIRMESWGQVAMATNLKRVRPSVSMRMQLDDGFVKKNSLGPLLNVNQVRKGKLKDWYGFSIYGTVEKIQFKGSKTAAKGEPPPPAAGDPGEDSKPAEKAEKPK